MATTNSHSVDLNALPPHTALRVEIAASGIRQFVIAQRAGIREGQLSQILNGRAPLTDAIATAIREAIAQGAAA